MDGVIAWCERLIEWALPLEHIPIVYAGTGSTWQNSPVPFLEISFMVSGRYDELRCGEECFSFATDEMCIASQHFGCSTGRMIHARLWGLMLNVADDPQFAELYDRPVFHKTTINRPDRMAGLFSTLAIRCRQYDWIPGTYPIAPEFTEAQNRKQMPLSSRILIKNAFLDILACLLEEAQPASVGSTVLPESVHTAVENIELYASDPDMTLEDIADAAGLSMDHFGRVFRKHMGQPPMRYLRQVRIEKACYLLRCTTDRVEDIARRVGFEDPFHFSRVFKSVKGVSPREYRRAN